MEIGIGLIIASPLLRARQMAAAVQRELGNTPISTSEFLTSSGAPRQILDQLKSLGGSGVLLVGHEPQLSKVISLLISGDEGQMVEMKKGSLAGVEIPGTLEQGQGILKWLVTFRQMSLGRQL
jgi:phosphohistidine phosphatase